MSFEDQNANAQEQVGVSLSDANQVLKVEVGEAFGSVEDALAYLDCEQARLERAITDGIESEEVGPQLRVT